MKKRNLPILLFISILTLTQLMCITPWTRFGGSNDITLCTTYLYQLEDGTPVSKPVNKCDDYPTQQECNILSAEAPISIPSGYSLVSYSAPPFDCSTQVEKGVQKRGMTVILKSDSEAPAEAPTEPPTEEPTEEPASTEAPTDPAPLKPFLTGTFTTCDNEARYVNFSIAEDAPPYDPATFKVTFNGYPVNCAPAPNNPKILTCNYPPVSYQPPAGVQVFIGEELVNEFDFNGGKICNPAPQPNTNDNNDNEGEQQPAPTEEPTELPPPDENSNGG